jgi:hypothetical protein
MRVRAVGEAGQGDRTGLFVAAGGEVALAKRSSALATAPSAHSVSRAHGPDSSACRARSSSAALPPSPPPLASSITPPDTAIGGPPRAAIFLCLVNASERFATDGGDRALRTIICCQRLRRSAKHFAHSTFVHASLTVQEDGNLRAHTHKRTNEHTRLRS